MQQQQKEEPPKPAPNATLTEREIEMNQALQSTLRTIHAERTMQAAEAVRQTQTGQGKKSERESTSPVEVKSPKTRRRRSKAGGL